MLGFTEIAHRWFGRPYQLHVAIDAGKGEQTVVLLHGLASNGQVWRRIVPLLEQHRRLLALDLLGFGASPKPTWLQYQVNDQAKSVLLTLKKQGVQFPVTIVGHSMGCLVAVHLAAKYPHLVKRVILYEPPLFADIPEFSSHIRRRKIYFSIFERIVDSPTMVLTYARMFGRAAAKVAGFALTEETWVPFERSLRNTIMDQTAYQELHSLMVPTDIVYGRFDIVVTQTEIKNMFSDNANIKFHRVMDTHGISKTSAAALAQLVRQGAPKQSGRRRKSQKR